MSALRLILEALGAGCVLAFSLLMGVIGWTSMMEADRQRRRPTPAEWDLAMANALDMAGSLELEIAEDPRELVLSFLRQQMQRDVPAEVRAAFVAAALNTIDRRRQAWGMRPLEYAITGYDNVPPGARVYRGHPDGMIAETLYEQQLREQREADGDDAPW